MASIQLSTAPDGLALKQTGENIFDINPELGLEHAKMRKMISAAQAWPVAGDWGVKTFHAFASFPKEIRQRIWRLVAGAQEPRIVNIFVSAGELHCNGLTPQVFHACSEARQEALFVYDKIVFDGINTAGYVNFQRDWVFFDTILPLIKVFGPKPEYSIFQEKCRKIAVLTQPAIMYNTTIKTFAKLDELALVYLPPRFYNDDGGGDLGLVKRFSVVDVSEHSRLVGILLGAQERLENDVHVPITLVHVVREMPGKVMNQVEKERARMKREQERDAMTKLRINESSAFDLQYDIDLRKINVEVKECPLEDPDAEEDEFGFGMRVDDVFSDDYMNIG